MRLLSKISCLLAGERTSTSVPFLHPPRVTVSESRFEKEERKKASAATGIPSSSLAWDTTTGSRGVGRQKTYGRLRIRSELRRNTAVSPCPNSRSQEVQMAGYDLCDPYAPNSRGCGPDLPGRASERASARCWAERRKLVCVGNTNRIIA